MEKNEFDEKAAEAEIKKQLEPYTNWNEPWPFDQLKGFVKGARWQHSQDQDRIERLKYDLHAESQAHLRNCAKDIEIIGALNERIAELENDLIAENKRLREALEYIAEDKLNCHLYNLNFEGYLLFAKEALKDVK